jgi:hypothetical protein
LLNHDCRKQLGVEPGVMLKYSRNTSSFVIKLIFAPFGDLGKNVRKCFLLLLLFNMSSEIYFLESRVWWYMCVVPALGRLRQENLELEATMG